MLVRLGRFWESLRSSYWFLPGAMTIGAVGLAIGMIALDERADLAPEEYGWIFAGGPAGAREVLSSIAVAMVTVAGVVFSVTTVSLTLASQQFGSRLLRTFMRDRGNQVVLGAFLATFAYCLIILRTVRGEDGEADQFVPHLSVSTGVGLSLVSVGVLIYFIHHAAQSIQAENVLARVSAELVRAIDRLFPEYTGTPPERTSDARLPENFNTQARRVPASASGYVQGIDVGELLRVAVSHDLVIRLDERPGAFVVEGARIAMIWPGERVDPAVTRQVVRALVLGGHRTEYQDIEFLFDQLAQVAARSLSTSINDPYTVAACIDRLGECLVRLAARGVPSPFVCDDAGRLRIVIRTLTFTRVAESAFRQIWHYGRTTPDVAISILDTIAAIAPSLRRQEDRSTLQFLAQAIAAESRDSLQEEWARQEVRERYRAVSTALQP